MSTLNTKQFPQPDGDDPNHEHCLHDNDSGRGQYCCKSGCPLISDRYARYSR